MGNASTGPVLLFLDTEFTGLMADPSIISIALVSKDGREFYAKHTDTWTYGEYKPFLQEEVLPFLGGGDKRMTWRELVEQLPAWIANIDCPVQIATDAVAAEWQWGQTICCATNIWSRNLSHEPIALPSGEGKSEQRGEYCYESVMWRHYALDGAKVATLGWADVGKSIRNCQSKYT